MNGICDYFKCVCQQSEQKKLWSKPPYHQRRDELRLYIHKAKDCSIWQKSLPLHLASLKIMKTFDSTITFKNDNILEMRQTLLTRLKAYNRSHCQWLAAHPAPQEQHNVFAFDGDTPIGGAVGYVAYNWYMLDLLYVHEEYHGQHIGTKLLGQIEAFARNKHLTGIRLETWDFQAKGFYEKNGYTVFAELKDYPPGSTVYFIKKEL